MGRYLATRLLASLLNLVLVTVLVFVMLHVAPGDPADYLVGPDATEADRAEARRLWGLDRPLPVQYLAYAGNALRGDLGTSLYFQEPVAQLIRKRAAATLELGALAVAIVLGVSFVLGVTAGARPHGLLDQTVMMLAVCGVAMPAFWLALLLILVLGGALQLLPVAGRLSYGTGLASITGFHLVDSVLTANGAAFWDSLRHLVLPAAALAGPGIALQSRLLRSNLLEVMGEDYVRTARAKGLGEPAVIGRHAVWNALTPVLSSWGVLFVFLLSGSVIVETIFAWPGLGRTAIQAINNRDYPLVQGVVLVFTSIVVVANFAVDALCAWIDPRVHYGRGPS
ncbi:MAG TPA: ABC transporter permease [Methylomirabilota bacterium]|nr:ABC transporter permease [Methylomirabilota bacterium]